MAFGKAPQHALAIATEEKCYQSGAAKATAGEDSATARIQVWEEESW